KGKGKKAAISSETSGGEDCSGSISSSAMSTTTREDEDMANCLILLSHGGFRPPAGCGISGGRFGEVEKVGVFVYECKTCLRAFSSFQALGGHRASHRKPKADDRRKSPAEDYDEKVAVPPAASLAQKEKIHECSVCGSVFSSGQALGGHMRRHR
ncbi:hypothetical protein M569_04037, partial [Genlisea aurea]